MYALFKNNKQISKAHTTKRAALIEAYELNVVIRGGKFLGLIDGYKVKEVL